MNLNIDPKLIEAAVTEAVVKSAIGTSLQKAVETSFSGDTYRGPSQFQQAVNSVVAATVSEVLRSDPYKTQIEVMVREKLTAEVLKDVCDKVTDRIVNAAWRD